MEHRILKDNTHFLSKFCSRVLKRFRIIINKGFQFDDLDEYFSSS